MEILDEVKRLFRETAWDPDEGRDKADAALDKIVDLTTDLLAIVRAFTETPPPVALLEVHRETTRSLSELGVVIGHFVGTLVAINFEEARQFRQEGQAALDRAAERANRLSQVVERLDRITELAPGWWTIQGEYDTGRVAWEAMDRRVGTIGAAADLATEELGEVPGVAQLPDEFAALLLPVLSAVSFQDPLRLVRKATLARSLLDRADSTNPSWVSDPALLTQRVWRGHRQLIAQIVRLGFQMRSEAPRNILLETAVGVYQKLIEGPLLHLGLPILVASNVPHDSTLAYDASSCEPAQVGDVLNHFLQSEPSLIEGAEMILRNADAHYDFDLTNEGIEFRDRRIRGGVVTRRREMFMRDDDFLEQLLTLNETLVALELAALPYLWQHPSPAVEGELESLSRTQESRLEQLRFLAGLQGFVEVQIEQVDEVLRIRATCESNASTNPFIEIQPTVAAAWTLWDDVTRVELNLEFNGEDRTLELLRGDFPRDEANRLIRSHNMALHMRNVKRSTERLTGQEEDQLDARFALLPGLLQIREGVQRFAEEPSVPAGRELVRYLRWLRDLLPLLQIGESLESVGEELLDLARTIERQLNTWIASQASGNVRLATQSLARLEGATEGLIPLSTRIAELLPDE